MSEELKDKMYQKLSLYSNELEDRIEDLEKLNTTITMENERLINEMKKLEKDNQTLMNSIVTEAHTKETKEIERLNNIIKEVREYIENNQEEHKFTDRGGFTYTEGHFLRDSDTLLEILDKVDKDV